MIGNTVWVVFCSACPAIGNKKLCLDPAKVPIEQLDFERVFVSTKRRRIF
jgi:hypothetical protein